MNQPKNLLSTQSSPYLLQHKNNPVAWMPWGQDAFSLARSANKPVFLSIGYSSCYWCHVMEQDSFESDEVAQVLNNHFIPLKVDREERPDIDEIYMDAVVAMTGRGGWPLSVFLTPDKKPFWGGTFFYREQFVSILKKLSELWITDRSNILSSADEITRHLNRQRASATSLHLNLQAADMKSLDDRALQALITQADMVNGGFGAAPKFPPHSQIKKLLGYIESRTSDKEKSQEDQARQIVELTLNSMLFGGIFDQVAGGFHRYSTDSSWTVPHFEKMLYDNALLAGIYSEAFRIFKEKRYEAAARRTLEFCMSEMSEAADQPFFTAYDAGEVGREGEYYTWTVTELQQILDTQEFELLQENFTVSPEGNFENSTNILCARKDFYSQYNLYTKINLVLEKLSAARSRRNKPFLDYKSITSWNGMMIEALAAAGNVLADDTYVNKAVAVVNYIRLNLYKNRLYRINSRNVSSIFAQLEDYAFLISALLKLNQGTQQPDLLVFADQLMREQIQYLWDDQLKSFCGSCQEELIVRKSVAVDNALPSALAVSATNLMKLDAFFPENRYRDYAEKVLNNCLQDIVQFPSATLTLLEAYGYFLNGISHYLYVDSPAVVAKVKIIRQQCGSSAIFTRINPDSDYKAIPKLEFYQRHPPVDLVLCDAQGCRIIP